MRARRSRLDCWLWLWMFAAGCRSPDGGEPADVPPPAAAGATPFVEEHPASESSPAEPSQAEAAPPVREERPQSERVAQLLAETRALQVLAELKKSDGEQAARKVTEKDPADTGARPDKPPIDERRLEDLLARAAAARGEPGEVTRGAGEGQPPPADTPAPSAKPAPPPAPSPPAGTPPAPQPGAQAAGQTPAAAPASTPAAPASQQQAAPAPRERPKGLITIRELYHKTADEVIRFLQEQFPDWIEKGHVGKVESKARSVVVFGDTPDANDPLTKKILSVLDSFDDLELKLESRVIRPRYVDVRIVMDTLVMRGLANIWQLTEETNTATQVQPDGKTTIVGVHKHTAFARTGIVSQQGAPIPIPPKVPYVYEVPTADPFIIPTMNPASGSNNQTIVGFNQMSSTEERGSLIAVGTYEDLERIQAFIDSIDLPARQIMIEVQAIELEANKLLDVGFDSFQFGKRHTLGTGAFPLPGDPIIQPGVPGSLRRPGVAVPDITQEGLGLIFDDTSIDLSGRFLTTLHALVREGDATVKARPKILTLDDRVSVLHIGQDVPVFKSTGVTRDATNGNLVSEVNQVATQYVGFTLNIRPRISGGAADEVSLQIEIIVNELGERQRVFQEDLLGLPTIIKRQYVGQNRVKNHRPIVLGGLIQEREVESVNKIPLLSEIPLLGYLFRRTQKSQSRMEVILVLTPHILSDKGVDRVATPKESIHFDTFDSVLFNDRHIIKGRDVIGVDPITGNPAQADGKVFTEEEVIDLTLLNIVKERELVSKLHILDDYLGDAAKDLNWIQKKYPEETVREWPPEKQEIYFRAAAIVIENVKELNPDLTYEEIITPRREILLPTTPYRISLTYDRVKALQTLGAPIVLRGERVELSEKTVALAREAAGKNLRDFADFLESKKRKAEDHGELLSELKRFYSSQYPERPSLDGIPYPQVYRELALARFDFVSLATYFQENLTNRYRTTGAPDVGAFEVDLKVFTEASVGLSQRARRLKELDAKWDRLNRVDEEGEAVVPEVENP